MYLKTKLMETLRFLGKALQLFNPLKLCRQKRLFKWYNFKSWNFIFSTVYDFAERLFCRFQTYTYNIFIGMLLYNIRSSIILHPHFGS